MDKVSKLISVFALGTLLFAGCVQPIQQSQETDSSTNEKTTTQQPVESETITIGTIVPLTGDGASYGVPAQRVIEYAVKNLNERGGINGKKLEIIWEDGKCNGKDASIAANKLVNLDKVKVILGGFCSGETLGAAPITEAAQVILFSAGSSSPAITNAGDFVFRNWPSDSSQGKILAQKGNELGFKKVGMISEQSDYAVGIRDTFKQIFTGETVIEEYLADDADFKTQLTKLKSQNVEGLFINPQTPDKADLIIKQLQELNFKPQQIFLNDAAGSFVSLITKYAEYLEGSIAADMGVNTENPELKALQDYYRQTFGEELPYTAYSTTEYDSVFILAEAIAQAGIENTIAIKDYLYSIKNRQGLAGSLTIDENGDPIAGHILKVIRGGKTENL